ncbi:MAG TPA: purine-nucleoside phosphorylase [Caldithrix abyssi]|uniref:Purine nucleoside phosphorylase n=1 Tax=Caldithrix abyssi TaxID=187145 RepID=A0A7V5H483_CALAY|nr:purine-nucleoside phosphorylase [Caldithrix abyssi]
MEFSLKKKVEEAVAYIKQFTDLQPQLAIILGSGLGPFADTLEEKVVIPTQDIPYYPKSTVEGHAGALVFGKHAGVKVMAVKGRTHYYEGYSIKDVTFVVRIMQMLKIPFLIVTNAAGSANPRLQPGDLMLITDHINFLFANPLRGPLEFGPPRFPDMSNVYSRQYFDLIDQIALERGIALKHGVLWVTTGPSYETAAEVKMIHKFGGDAISMSTVPEVITAVHSGMKVIGISCITNFATGITSNKLSHDEVTETANRVKKKFTSLVSGIIESIDMF